MISTILPYVIGFVIGLVVCAVIARSYIKAMVDKELAYATLKVAALREELANRVKGK